MPTILGLPQQNAPAIILAILHERMDILERLKSRLGLLKFACDGLRKLIRLTSYSAAAFASLIADSTESNAL